MTVLSIRINENSEANQAELARRIADMEAGRNCSVHELIEVEDDEVDNEKNVA
jgi:hypothetical protein